MLGQCRGTVGTGGASLGFLYRSLSYIRTLILRGVTRSSLGITLSLDCAFGFSRLL